MTRHLTNLEPYELDYLIAQIDHPNQTSSIEDFGQGPYCSLRLTLFNPSLDWKIGGDIIQENRISTMWTADPINQYTAAMPENINNEYMLKMMQSSNHLISAMKCYVHYRYNTFEFDQPTGFTLTGKKL